MSSSGNTGHIIFHWTVGHSRKTKALGAIFFDRLAAADGNFISEKSAFSPETFIGHFLTERRIFRICPVIARTGLDFKIWFWPIALFLKCFQGPVGIFVVFENVGKLTCEFTENLSLTLNFRKWTIISVRFDRRAFLEWLGDFNKS